MTDITPQEAARLGRKQEEPVIDFAYNSDEWWPQVVQEIRRHPASERFHTILRECGELHDKKQRDYGRDDDPFANVRSSEEWGVPAWVGALVRATDKVRRLQTFAQKGELANESVIDSLNDLANYAIIARVLYEQDCDTGFYEHHINDESELLPPPNGHDCDCGRDPDCNGQCECGMRY